MNCPTCSATLSRVTYEGLTVLGCAACLGYLVTTRRIDSIKRRREKDQETLRREARTIRFEERESILRCPRCHAQMMRESVVRPAFEIDRCKSCNLVWFDAGELAYLQLHFESTDQAIDASRMQDRHRFMSPERRRAFEKNLARLPEGDATLASVFGRALLESIDRYDSES